MGTPRRRRIAATLLTAALLAGACSQADEDTGGIVESADPSPDPSAGGSSSPATGTPAAGAGEVPDTVPGSAPATGGGGGQPAPTTAAGPGQQQKPPPDRAAAPAPAPAGVGAYAPFYLRPSESTRVVLEVRSQAGAEPNGATIDHLRGVLAQVSGKEVATAGGSLTGGARQWTAADIRALADTSSLAQSRDGAVLRLLFLRGGFADSDTALGVAVRSDVAAIFSDRVDQAAGLLADRARIEDAVTVHEAGHLLGLVDLFLATGRADPEHPGHSPNRGSVMYYAVESTLVDSILDGGPPTEFDAQDRADLAAIRQG
jgi:hypothetical protein